MNIYKIPDEQTSKRLESYIASQDMVSLGTRRPDILGAIMKIQGWSSCLQEEFAVGYKTMVINSKGEQFGDRESKDEIFDYFESKDMSCARDYIKGMHDLNESLLEKIPKYPNADYKEGFTRLMMYFLAIRLAIEFVYENANGEDQKVIDDWRNDTTLFSSWNKYYEIHPQQDEASEWSMVLVEGEIFRIDKIITCAKHPTAVSSGASTDTTGDIKEIKGNVGYPGTVRGRARVVLKKEEIELIEDGEIIVAPMTTLDFVPAMGKASAFVTDEGGITCHAAIVAREMKKPCIIGTRVGSKIMKTGEMIQVDAVKGVVIRLGY